MSCVLRSPTAAPKSLRCMECSPGWQKASAGGGQTAQREDGASLPGASGGSSAPSLAASSTADADAAFSAQGLGRGRGGLWVVISKATITSTGSQSAGLLITKRSNLYTADSTFSLRR